MAPGLMLTADAAVTESIGTQRFAAPTRDFDAFLQQ
jgi:hypothetical protein